jgi:UDP-N-acetylmuramoyl-tripeptide--D-alanyl-D-alanine ligase
MALSAMPDIAVITSIGVSHLEHFGSQEGILREKLSVTAGMKAGSTLVLCGDNEYLRGVSRPALDIMLYGIENPACEVRADNIAESLTRATFDIIYGDVRYEAELPLPGRHNVLNALAAFCVGVKLGVMPEKAAAALKNYRPEGMRQKVVEHNGYTVVEDCYNASPDSMRAALATLGGVKSGGRRLAVFSDMLELGKDAVDYHKEIGAYAAKSGIDFLFCTGPLSSFYCEGAAVKGMGTALHFGAQDYLVDYLKVFLKPKDIVWFKASRGMRLEKAIERLYSE